jgi:DNA-binding NarL/FixJ family response regulator
MSRTDTILQRKHAGLLDGLINKTEAQIDDMRESLSILKLLRKSLTERIFISERQQLVWRLRQQGWKMDAIARHLKISQPAVTKIYKIVKDKLEMTL